ncbi:hypothetical protein BO86DRAFT_388689 [Aspergillus japonicus CBS 114.51]|nr:hypothetical protein BO86DRAFT_388689 [Aspergillus japonicus CBS 114.51]RAH82521.1 hypothetical protein BO86DRAFT_388689 [Aspergillus japonicus CBS 114.51]
MRDAEKSCHGVAVAAASCFFGTVFLLHGSLTITTTDLPPSLLLLITGRCKPDVCPVRDAQWDFSSDQLGTLVE